MFARMSAFAVRLWLRVIRRMEHFVASEPRRAFSRWSATWTGSRESSTYRPMNFDGGTSYTKARAWL